jgi:hypothetical protein
VCRTRPEGRRRRSIIWPATRDKPGRTDRAVSLLPGHGPVAPDHDQEPGNSTLFDLPYCCFLTWCPDNGPIRTGGKAKPACQCDRPTPLLNQNKYRLCNPLGLPLT